MKIFIIEHSAVNDDGRGDLLSKKGIARTKKMSKYFRLHPFSFKIDKILYDNEQMSKLTVDLFLNELKVEYPMPTTSVLPSMDYDEKHMKRYFDEMVDTDDNVLVITTKGRIEKLIQLYGKSNAEGEFIYTLDGNSICIIEGFQEKKFLYIKDIDDHKAVYRFMSIDRREMMIVAAIAVIFAFAVMVRVYSFNILYGVIPFFAPFMIFMAIVYATDVSLSLKRTFLILISLMIGIIALAMIIIEVGIRVLS